MGVTVGVNNLSVVHKSSHSGKCISFPDVCKTPSPAGPIPIPYPNSSYGQQNAAASKTTAVGSKTPMTKSSNLSMSSGDEAGTLKGMASYQQGATVDQQLRVMHLRGQLHMLHAQIANLPSGNPTRWHKLLDDYVIYTAELYKTLSE